MYQFETVDIERVVAILGRIADPQRQLSVNAAKLELVNAVLKLVDGDIFCWTSTVINPEILGDSMIQHLHDGGWRDDREKALFYECLLDPRWHTDVCRVMCGLIRDNKYRTLYTEDYMAAALPEALVAHEAAWSGAGFGHYIMSTYSLNDNVGSIIGLTRRVGRPKFTERERMLAHLIFSQVDWLHRNGLDVPCGKTVLRLSPRERQVLIQLMGGNSLKQIAVSMGLSRNTVDTHVKSIYRQLKVNSRPELMSQFTAGNFVA